MSRSLPEWQGRTPDSPIPPRVRVRIFERYHGVCHLSGRKIRAGEKWEPDHIVALINGGKHVESNLAPALVDKHKEKTRADVAEKSEVYRKRAKFLGIRKPSTLRSQGFRKAAPQRSASKPLARHADDNQGI